MSSGCMAILLHLCRDTIENVYDCTPGHWHAVLVTHFTQSIGLQAARLSDLLIHAWDRVLSAVGIVAQALF